MLNRELFRRKTVSELQAEAAADHSLRRALSALSLTTLGIGAIIGTGIFVLTGTVAALHSGPAVVLSFAIAGLASGFAALCYAEFASLRMTRALASAVLALPACRPTSDQPESRKCVALPACRWA